MKYIVAFGILLVALAFLSPAYAQDVNFICKNDCLSKSKTLGECNALCSTADEAGNATKDMSCINSCTSKGGSYYNCYSACGAGANAGEVSAPAQESQ